MKTLIVLGIVLGLLVFAGIVLVINSKTVQADTSSTQETCQYGDASCPYKESGGCAQESNCGLNTCAAKYGGSCGCGK